MPRKTLSLMDVIFDVRDCGLTKGSSYTLLLTLATRCNPREDYSCYPSYELLSRDTRLDVSTLKRGARELEELGLISREVRPNRSNFWYLNVAKIQKAADAARHEGQAGKSPARRCPFDAPIVKERTPAADALPTQAGGAEAENVELTPEATGAWSADDLGCEVAYFKGSIPAHPTPKLGNAESIMRQSISACFKLAGGISRYRAVFNWALTNYNSDIAGVNRRGEALSKSRYLGGYLQKVFLRGSPNTTAP